MAALRGGYLLACNKGHCALVRNRLEIILCELPNSSFDLGDRKEFEIEGKVSLWLKAKNWHSH
jgi:hypothetical protein